MNVDNTNSKLESSSYIKTSNNIIIHTCEICSVNFMTKGKLNRHNKTQIHSIIIMKILILSLIIVIGTNSIIQKKI
jgi:hypothetical protein